MVGQRWLVVGGADKGGVVVRKGKALSSEQEPERLSSGALVRQLGDLEGDRLHYERLVGTGPRIGWISVKLKDKELVAQVDGRERFEVIFKPRVVARMEPKADGHVARILQTGQIIEAEDWSEDGKWIEIYQEELVSKQWLLLEHAEHGLLLKMLPPSTKRSEGGDESDVLTKKSWDVEFKFKGCGANLTALAGGIDGASRDQLFDFLTIQHINETIRVEFRSSIPDHMFDSSAADEADCVVFFQTGGHIVPEPGRRKTTPGGVRQHIARFGELRCIVLEADGDATISAIFVLAHGWNVLGDDLFGLAHRLIRPGLRLILPEAPDECEIESDPEMEWKRKPRRWFLPSDAEKGANIAGLALARCAAEALEHTPGAKLLLGGFSQGAASVLCSAVYCVETLKARPSGMLLLNMGLPSDSKPFPAACLTGTRVLVAAGSKDEVAPIAGCEKLLASCKEAGAKAAPLLQHNGAHEITMEVVKGAGQFISDCLQ